MGNVLICLGCRREVEGFKGIRRLAVGSQQCGRRWDWTGISTYEVVDSSEGGKCQIEVTKRPRRAFPGVLAVLGDDVEVARGQ